MTIDPAVVITAIGALATGIGAVARVIYNDLKRDRDFWRDAFLKSVVTTDEALKKARAKAPGA